MDKPLDAFLNYLQYERQYSEHTLRAYHSDLLIFGEHIQKAFDWNVLEKAEDCTHIKANHIRAWVATLEGERTTVFRRLSSVRSFFKFLFKKGVIDSNPTLKIQLQSRKRKLVSFIPQEEINTLLNERPQSFDFCSARDSLVLELLYGCGLRRSELSELRYEQILWSEKLLKINGKGNKQRLVPFGTIVEEALKTYIQECDKTEINYREETFLKSNTGKKCYAQLIYLIVKNALASLPDLTRRHPHLLRHTFATHLVDQGADLNAVKELLGHSGLKSTEVYVHNSISKLKDLHQKLHPRG